MAVVEKLTIEDFEKLPPALAYYHELDDGQLVDVSGNTPRHIALRDFLAARMLLYVHEHRLGWVAAEQEYQFGDNAHGPDISFNRPGKKILVEGDRRVQPFVPDLAIEVVSKNDTFGSIVRKARRYIQYGTEEVWVFLISSREVYYYSKERDRILRDYEMFESALIPGLQIPLAELFDWESCG
jgi:Uma2 family endonuclease